MSQQNEINLKLNVTTNDSSIENAKRRLREIEVAQQSLAKSILDGNGDIDKATAEIDALSKEYLNLNKVLKQTGDSYETLAQEQKRAAESGSAAVAANDRFGKVSNDVALAGDIESNARAIGGAVGAFGGQGAATAIGQGAELFAVIEAAPRLNAALAGLPATLGAAATALGPVGLALGVLAAVAAAVAFAIGKSTEELGKATTAEFDNQRKINEAIASGSLDQNAARERTAELQRLIEAENKLKLEAEQRYQNSSFNILDQAFNNQEEALSGQAETSKNNLRDYQAELDVLNRNLEDGTIPAGQAAQAIPQVSRAMQQLGQASQQTASNVQGASRRIQESRNERLNREDREERAAALRAGIELSRQQESERKQRSQALREAIRARREQAKSERENAQKEQADTQDKQAELSRKFQQNEVKAAVDQYRTLEKIRDDALQSEQEAIREGNIFAIRDIREKANRDLAQSAKDFENQRQDRLVDFRTQFAELLQSINPSAAQGQFSAVASFQQQRAGNVTINANGLDLRQAQTLVQQTLGRTYR